MSNQLKYLTLKRLLKLVNGTFKGSLKDSDKLLGVGDLSIANNKEISFFHNPKYIKKLYTSQAGIILVPNDFDIDVEKNFIFCDNPSDSFAKVCDFFVNDKIIYPCSISKKASIADNVSLGKNIHIGENVVIADNVVIGDNTRIMANCYIGHNCVIENDVILNPNITIYHGSIIKKRVIIHSNTVIGSDGFGYISNNEGHEKIPQHGFVEIEEDVEIGSNCSIDRARFNKTLIGKGTKIDNLVQIGHNVAIGKNCIIVSSVGIAGSTKIGNSVIVAGGARVCGHLEIGDNCVITATSFVTKSLKSNTTVYGSPATNRRDYTKRIFFNKSCIDDIKEIKKNLKI